MKTLNILGTDYSVIVKRYSEEPLFEKENIDGYCTNASKEIIVCDMHSHPEWKGEKESSIEVVNKEILRHEIIHAFLNESGLCASSLQYDGGWSRNEEMVDWIALQGIKIYNAWKQADCL